MPKTGNLGRSLGILSCSPNPTSMEHGFFRTLSRYGKSKDIVVSIFSPKKVLWSTDEVVGYQWSETENKWSIKRFAIPSLLYDRCFYQSSAHYREYKPFIRLLQEYPNTRFLGLGLTGKWEVYQILKHSEKVRQFLPPTEIATNPEKIKNYLQLSREAIIKPVGGSLGIGVTRIQCLSPNKYVIQGRNKANTPYSMTVNKDSFYRWLKHVVVSRRMLIQPYLSMTTPEQVPFDVRVLTQKNGDGQWEVVGQAIRIGSKNGLTSNLHGGGKAMALLPFLQHVYPEQATDILKQIDLLTTEVPPCLEASHGPLAELGLDIGIDTQAKVWLIEVNSKPGRSVFRQIREKEIERKSIQNLIDYACYLLKEGNIAK